MSDNIIQDCPHLQRLCWSDQCTWCSLNITTTLVYSGSFVNIPLFRKQFSLALKGIHFHELSVTVNKTIIVIISRRSLANNLYYKFRNLFSGNHTTTECLLKKKQDGITGSMINNCYGYCMDYTVFVYQLTHSLKESLMVCLNPTKKISYNIRNCRRYRIYAFRTQC